MINLKTCQTGSIMLTMNYGNCSLRNQQKCPKPFEDIQKRGRNKVDSHEAPLRKDREG